jgi:hypothetical protein
MVDRIRTIVLLREGLQCFGSCSITLIRNSSSVISAVYIGSGISCHRYRLSLWSLILAAPEDAEKGVLRYSVLYLCMLGYLFCTQDTARDVQTWL